MKKNNVFTAIIVVLAIGFTSCTKTHVCECSYPGSTSTDKSEIKTNKSDAKTKCEALSNAAKGAGGSCKLN